jgi:putative transposase
MPRPPRLEMPGVAHHVIQRGNNRGACFFGDADRQFYLNCLEEAARHRGCDVHAYVLMTNHVHLLVTPTEPGALGAMMQELSGRYVRVTNRIHARTGTLWEARFRSSLVDSENYLLLCQRYIELNPVRAGLVHDPSAYPWSSHLYYAAHRASRVITEHPVYLRLGLNAGERRMAYLSLFTEALNDHVLRHIRAAINSDSAFGSDAFLDDAEAKLGRSVRLPARGRPAKVLQKNSSDPFF